MQLGSRLGAHAQGTCVRRCACPALSLPPRLAPAPPPVSAPPRRSSVLARAKRASKRGSRKTQGDDSDGEAASGWDAALANVPLASDTPDDAQASAAPGSPESELDAAAAAERTAEQGPSDDDSEQPSTSEAAAPPDPDSGNAGRGRALVPRAKKPPSTVMRLAEYTMLMEARADKDAADEVERQERAAAEAAASGVALAVSEPAELDLNRQGFQAFVMEGGELELLVAETVDGRLALADSYLADRTGGPDAAAAGASGQRYSRPTLGEDIPSEPLTYQIIPWVERGGSDMFKRKEATNKVKKVYFVETDAAEGDGPDNPMFVLDNVFCFDSESRELGRCEVRVVGSGEFVEPVLRIRPSGLTLEESYLLPDPIEVSMETYYDDQADMSEEELAARLEELEQQAESMDELDEMPDVPSVDMM